MTESNRKVSTQLALSQKNQSRRTHRTVVQMKKKIETFHTTTKRNRRGILLVLDHERSLRRRNRKVYRRVLRYLARTGCRRIDAIGFTGETALHLAIQFGDYEAVSQLIQLGADVNRRNRNLETPLEVAISNRVNVFSHDILLNRLNFYGFDFLRNLADAAADRNQYEHNFINLHLVKILLDAGADVDERNSNYYTALQSAIYAGDFTLFKILVNAGADITNRSDRQGATPLHLASQLAMLEKVRFLISKGADVNAKDGFGSTPLGKCIIEPFDKRAYLKKSSPFLEQANFDQERKLVIRLLLENGGDLNQRQSKISISNDYPKERPSILEYAIDREDDLDAMNLIIEHVVEVDARSDKPLLDDYNQMRIDENGRIKRYYQKCQTELASMKTAEIEGTRITYYSILTEPLELLTLYANNENFVNAFLAENYTLYYSAYAWRLQEKFEAAIARCQLIQRASDVLSSILQFANSRHLVIDCILKYLSLKDLEILADIA